MKRSKRVIFITALACAALWTSITMAENGSNEKIYISDQESIHFIDNMIIIDTEDGPMTTNALCVDEIGFFVTSLTHLQNKGYCSTHGWYISVSGCPDCKKEKK